MLNESDRSIIDQYVDEKFFDRKRLMTYLSLHEIVGNEVFEYCFKKNEDNSMHYPGLLQHEYGYTPMPIDTFIRRIPFYFYVSGLFRGFDKVGDLNDLLNGLIREKKPELDLEGLYTALEYMFYKKGLSLDTIFTYTVEQSHCVAQYGLFKQWNHYLHLCDKLNINDPVPENFIVRYNEILEAAGLPPIIYEIEEYCYADLFFRSGDTIEFEGCFPCDKNGEPIMKWIGLQIKNPGSITCTSFSGMRKKLLVGLLPNTIIYALNCYNESDDEDGMWYQIYAGPLTMGFDYEAIRSARKRLKYTQKQVADAVGASVRTYQKWESGEMTPDGHYLLRILNWLDLPDVQYVTRYIE